MKAWEVMPRATEAQCQETIVAAAKLAGWLVHAERPVQIGAGRHATPIQGHAGFPDLVLTHPCGRLLFVELKRRPNVVEPAQKQWHDTLRSAGVDVAVWWVPEMLDQAISFLITTVR